MSSARERGLELAAPGGVFVWLVVRLLGLLQLGVRLFFQSECTFCVPESPRSKLRRGPAQRERAGMRSVKTGRASSSSRARTKRLCNPRADESQMKQQKKSPSCTATARTGTRSAGVHNWWQMWAGAPWVRAPGAQHATARSTSEQLRLRAASCPPYHRSSRRPGRRWHQAGRAGVRTASRPGAIGTQYI